jgi:hypothetical protein
MSVFFKPLLIAAVLSLATPVCAAEQPAPTHDRGPAAAPDAKGGKMAMDGMLDMGPMHCMGLSEQRLAGLKAELSVTDRQLKAWNTFTAAAKAEAHPMPGGMTGMMSGDGMMAMMMARPLPERLAHHEMMMREHLTALHKVRVATASLYRVLTLEQRVMADRSLCGGMAH